MVNYEIGYADGRRDELHMVDQLVPFTALRERGYAAGGPTSTCKFLPLQPE